MEEPTTVVGGTSRLIPDELVDQLLAGRELTAEAITGRQGLLQELTGRLVERALGAELSDHLGYEPGAEPPLDQSNRRNGTTPKTLATPHGEVSVGVPRDREASFEPRIIPKHQRRFEGFDEKIIALYAGGMTTRQIERHLEQVYGVAVGRDLVSRVTDAVLDDVSTWQSLTLPSPALGALLISSSGATCRHMLTSRVFRDSPGA